MPVANSIYSKGQFMTKSKNLPKKTNNQVGTLHHLFIYCLILIVCCRKISKYDPAALQDHILIFSCSIHSNYFYTILTQQFSQIRQYCLLLMNGGHIFLPPAFRFWKVTQYLTSALLRSNILSPSKTFRLVTNIWPPFIINKQYCLI